MKNGRQPETDWRPLRQKRKLTNLNRCAQKAKSTFTPPTNWLSIVSLASSLIGDV
jgi:hypothetical protein